MVSDLNKNIGGSTDLVKKGKDPRICIPVFTPLIVDSGLFVIYVIFGFSCKIFVDEVNTTTNIIKLEKKKNADRSQKNKSTEGKICK